MVQAFRGCYSRKGLMYMADWGNVPRVANANLVALIYSQYVITPSLRRQYRCVPLPVSGPSRQRL